MQTLKDLEGGRLQGKALALRGIEDGLSILGKSGQVALLHIIEAESGLKPEQLSDYPVAFVEALWDVFGFGATALLRSIVVELRRARIRTEHEAQYLGELAIILDESRRSIASRSAS
jgi:hypothetical protein